MTPGLLVVGGTMRGGTSLLHDILDSHPSIQLMELELRCLRYVDLANWSHVAAVTEGSLSTWNRFRSARFRQQARRYLWSILRGHGLSELTTMDRIHRGDWRGQAWAIKYNTVAKATDYWLTMMQSLRDVSKLETNALLVRYEDMVLQPAASFSAIAEHLAIPKAGFNARLPEPSSIGRCKDRLNQEQRAEVERRAGAMMESWGYTLGA